MKLNTSSHATLYLNDQEIADARKLYGWLKEGLELGEEQNVIEGRSRWLGRSSGLFRACAIGFALIGKYGDVEAAMIAAGPSPRAKHCAKALGIPKRLVKKISRVHAAGMPARMICEALRVQVVVHEACNHLGLSVFPRRHEWVDSLIMH